MFSANGGSLSEEELVAIVRTEMKDKRSKRVPRVATPGSLDADGLRDRLRRAFIPATNSHLHQLVTDQINTANVGVALPAMTGAHTLKRLIGRTLVKVGLRAANRVLSEQRAFNTAVVGFNRQLLDALDRAHHSLSTSTSEMVNELAEAGRKNHYRLALLEDELNRQELDHATKTDAEELFGRLKQLEARFAQLATEQVTINGSVAAVRGDFSQIDTKLRDIVKSVGQPEKLVEHSQAIVSFRESRFYQDFEARFRPAEGVSGRLEFYRPLVSHLKSKGARSYDLGCGRGEFMELMQAIGFKASGCDTNSDFITECKGKGFDASGLDALSALKQFPDGHFTVVSSIHVIEHVPGDYLHDLIRESFRVLRSGGKLLLETPNPENLGVGAASFYIDPTHLRPVHPLMLQFLLETTGFSDVGIHRLHPTADYLPADMLRTRWEQLINERVFGPQDFAAVATKP